MAPILLFDGVCNLCNGAVNFVLDHERGTALRFGSLQSSAGLALLDRSGGRPRSLDTVVVIDDEHRYERSAAILRLARDLRWPWRALTVLWIVPRPLRDALYDWVAQHRYRWFGKQEACRIPSPELRSRFLPQDNDPHSPGAVASIAKA